MPPTARSLEDIVGEVREHLADRLRARKPLPASDPRVFLLPLEDGTHVAVLSMHVGRGDTPEAAAEGLLAIVRGGS